MLKDSKNQHTYVYNGASQQTKPTRTDTINYVYDGMLAIQMRGASISSYTRGLDLSQSLQGAGGIGGLLAQSTPAHSYYHSDGNGNITYLMKADQSLGASYRYDDAYGNVVTTSGTLSNPFRFSSKEWLPRISAYYYGYRFYYPSIQRWLNRDPIEERGGFNLYSCVKNNPVNASDPLGLFVSADPSIIQSLDPSSAAAGGAVAAGFGVAIFVAPEAIATGTVVAKQVKVDGPILSPNPLHNNVPTGRVFQIRYNTKALLRIDYTDLPDYKKKPVFHMHIWPFMKHHIPLQPCD